MKRRLDLAMTLVGDPRVIFLDEPTTGLDPRSRRTMWQSSADLVAGGVTILLTTQYLDEADQLADRIAVLDGGRIVAEGTAGRAQAAVPGGHVALFADPRRRDAAARLLGGRPRRRALTLTCPATAAGAAARPAGPAGRRRRRGRRTTVHAPDLDDVFFALTGHPPTAPPPRPLLPPPPSPPPPVTP